MSGDAATLIKGYKVYVLPILDYNSVIWSPYKAGDIIRIESVQRCFLKYLKGFEGLSYKERLVKADLSTLELRRLYSDLILCYKIVHNIIPLDCEKNFKRAPPTINTRGNKFKLKQIKAKSAARFNFFTARVVNAWNSLPNVAVCAENAVVFKFCVKQFDMSKYLIQNFDYDFDEDFN